MGIKDQSKNMIGKETIRYNERESKRLEFKSKLPKLSALIKTVVAFANGFGGKIIIGVDDQRFVVGVSDDDRDRLYDAFPNSLYDAVTPSISPAIYEQRLNEVSVLVIDIPPCNRQPYFVKKEGIPNGVYVRVGSSTRRATEEVIEDLYRQGKRIHFEEESLSAPMSILSDDLLRIVYGEQVTRRQLVADSVIVHSPDPKNTYRPTVAGTLLYSEKPHRYVPEAVVLCTRFAGVKGRDIVLTEELTGPLAQLSEKALRLTCSWLERDYKLQGASLTGSMSIPKEALREAIINALVHRKYSVPGAVKVAVFDDRCEIFSPGCFSGLIDLAHLGDGTTYLRNPVLARTAHRMGLIEKLGSGIKLIFASCQKAGLKKPEYSEGGDFVKVVFFFEKNYKGKGVAAPVDEMIEEWLEKHKAISIKEVCQFGVSRNTATRKLVALTQKGRLVRKGKGPSVRYYVIE